MRSIRSCVFVVAIFFLSPPCYAISGDQDSLTFIKLDSQAQELPDSAADWVMVKDTRNGLIWEVKTDDNSIHNMDKLFSWKKSKKLFIKQLNEEKFGGFSDWRLPEAEELSSLLDKSKEAPFINENYFPKTSPELYLGWELCGDGISINSSKIHFGDPPPKDKKKKKKRQFRVRAVRGKVAEQ